MKVRDVIKMIQADGWIFVRQVGSHRFYKHPVKKGGVTVSGHPSDTVHLDNLASICKQAQIPKPRRK